MVRKEHSGQSSMMNRAPEGEIGAHEYWWQREVFREPER